MRNHLVQFPYFGGNETQVGNDHLRKTVAGPSQSQETRSDA